MFVLELIAIALTLFVAISIVWSTIKVGISPMPSSGKARDALFKLMEDTGAGPVCDLGSGWGSLIVPLAKKYPNRKIIGYEVSLVPWLVTVFLKQIFGLKNLVIYRKDFLRVNLSNADVLICYLHRETMTAVAEKLTTERRFDGILISNTFGLGDVKPEKTVQINDFYKSPIYRYRLSGFDV